MVVQAKNEFPRIGPEHVAIVERIQDAIDNNQVCLAKGIRKSNGEPVVFLCHTKDMKGKEFAIMPLAILIAPGVDVKNIFQMPAGFRPAS